jgi:hypothetical protein
VHWHEIRGHLLTATGRRLEDLDVHDFLDVAYSYGINSPESRDTIRSGILGYMFEFAEAEAEGEMTHEGFVKQALSPSMLDELDAFSGLG